MGRKEDMSMKKKGKPWVSALIASGVTVLLYSAVFPLYRLTDYLIAAAAAALIGRLVFIMAQGVDTSKKAPPQESFAPTGDAAADEIIKRGQEMMAQIREENDKIPDPELSEKIDRLNDVANRIFRTVSEQPGKAPQIRRFMDYYLPTTLKMLSGYQKMDERKVTGATADATRRQIEDAMDVILKAFNHQLDTMYQDDMLDISTDIDVLETLLKQDGLIDSGMRGSKEMPKEASPAAQADTTPKPTFVSTASGGAAFAMAPDTDSEKQ